MSQQSQDIIAANGDVWRVREVSGHGEKYIELEQCISGDPYKRLHIPADVLPRVIEALKTLIPRNPQ